MCRCAIWVPVGASVRVMMLIGTSVIWPGTGRIMVPSGPNQPPVAVEDTASVLQGQTTLVQVLTNDWDPEGQNLILTDAQAATGLVTFDPSGTITYEADPTYIGIDSVTYNVRDPGGSQNQGVLLVDVLPDIPLGLDLEANNIIKIVLSSSSFTLNVTTPTEFAGDYSIDPSLMNNGPLCLVPPRILDLAIPGQLVQALPGLWVHEDANAPNTMTYQWQLDGLDVEGETNATFAVLPQHSGAFLQVVVRLSDTAGAREQTSAGLTVEPAIPDTDSFTASDGVLLSAYSGETGNGWVSFFDGDSPAIYSEHLIGQDTGIAYWKQDRPTVINQRVSGEIAFGAAPTGSMAIACRCTNDAGSYWFMYRISTSEWSLFRDTITLMTATPDVTGFGPGQTRVIAIEAIGDTVTGFVDGVQVLQTVDTRHPDGTGGVRSFENDAPGVGFALNNFKFEVLT